MMPIKTQNKLYKSLLMHLRAATIVLSSIADEGVTLWHAGVLQFPLDCVILFCTIIFTLACNKKREKKQRAECT